MTICIVGPCRSGKTLILKRLQDNNFKYVKDFFSLPPTVKTNGTNLLRLIKRDVHRKEEIEFILQEIGGEIIELCLDFIQKSSKLIYVLDASEFDQLSFNFEHLMRILTSLSVINKPVLIVLNKIDVCSSLHSTEEFKEMLFLDQLQNEFVNNSLQIIESSCMTGKGINEIYEWIIS